MVNTATIYFVVPLFTTNFVVNCPIDTITSDHPLLTQGTGANSNLVLIPNDIST